jgi:uridine kinase
MSHVDLAKNCLVVAVSGGDCSGKKLLMNAIAKELAKKQVKMAVLNQESFYKESYTASDVSPSGKKGSIFTPENTDWEQFEKTLTSMIIGNRVTVRKYDFMAQKLLPNTIAIDPSPLILVTGLHIFTSKVIRNLSDVSVFI